MNIPDKAVEAAAYALDDYWGGRYAPHVLDELSDEMRAVLEAAAPHIAAQALERLADTMHREGGHFEEFDPKSPRAAEWAAAIQAYSKRVRVLANDEMEGG